jgi:hypothetical protein
MEHPQMMTGYSIFGAKCDRCGYVGDLAIVNSASVLSLCLDHAPNADIRNGTGYWASPVDAAKAKVRVDGLRAASEALVAWVERNELGFGNMTRRTGLVVDAAGAKVAQVSYNGRIWGVDGKEIVP